MYFQTDRLSWGLTPPISTSDPGLQKIRRQSKIEYFSMKSFLSSKYMYVVYRENRGFNQNSIFRIRQKIIDFFYQDFMDILYAASWPARRTPKNNKTE